MKNLKRGIEFVSFKIKAHLGVTYSPRCSGHWFLPAAWFSRVQRRLFDRTHLMHDVAIRLKTPGSTSAKGQGCQFGFCEAKFVILGFLSTPLNFFNF